MTGPYRRFLAGRFDGIPPPPSRDRECEVSLDLWVDGALRATRRRAAVSPIIRWHGRVFEEGPGKGEAMFGSFYRDAVKASADQRRRVPTPGAI